MKNFTSAAVLCVSLALLPTTFFGQKKPEESKTVAAITGTAAKRFVPETLPVSSIRRGMRGVAYTVFEGTKPEPMEVEILGVLPNMNGPKSDIILARLHGKAEYTGVVAGMSGSPVYIDGKLIGDRKSTRLNSSHLGISYAVFCLKKKKKNKLERMSSNKTKRDG